MQLQAKQKIQLGTKPGSTRSDGKKIPPEVTTVLPGESFEVEDGEGDRLVTIGAAVDPSQAPAAPESSDDSGDGGDERSSAILEAMIGLDPDDGDLWNQDGSPKVAAVRNAAEDDTITQEEVKSIWGEGLERE